MSVMLTFTVFEIESSHYPNDETCNSKIQAITQSSSAHNDFL